MIARLLLDSSLKKTNSCIILCKNFCYTWKMELRLLDYLQISISSIYDFKNLS